jgi:phospho-acceptor domain-containing protein
VRFDDRLTTVLAQRPTDARDRAVRWRQLVELLARAGKLQSPLTQQAYAEAKGEAAEIDEQLRAATARAIAGPQLPADLVALFAADTIAVSAPVLAAAQLSPEEWSGVVEQASPNSRRFLRSLHPELVEEQPEVREEPAPVAEIAEEPLPTEAPPEAAPAPAEPVTPAAPEHAVPSISEVVARIERLRRERERLTDRHAAPPREAQAPSGAPALFRWECGPSGEIAWVEGAPRGPLIGRSLANPGEHNGVDEAIQRAFAVRAPFRDATLSVAGEGAVAGEWKLSGVPAFEPSDGRFAGYRGVATRVPSGAAAEPRRATIFDHDSIRELVHELKTPLNAIIGFAEIIDGQYLGPAEQSYRERAAEIVAQSRLLLSAIEDLDLAAQLRSAPEQAGGSTDLRELVARTSVELVEQAGRLGATLLIELPARSVHCAVEQGLAGRIVRRFCGSIIDAAVAGERLGLALTGEADRCLLALDKPKALRDAAAQAVPGAPAVSGPYLPTGVSLRLARALARVAGGDLIDAPDGATLVLPRAA